MKTKEVYMALKRSWWYGFAFAIGFNMMVQDYMGLEKYLAYTQEHWIDIPWIVGLLIAAFGLYLHVGMLGRFAWLDETKEKENEVR